MPPDSVRVVEEHLRAWQVLQGTPRPYGLAARLVVPSLDHQGVHTAVERAANIAGIGKDQVYGTTRPIRPAQILRWASLARLLPKDETQGMLESLNATRYYRAVVADPDDAKAMARHVKLFGKTLNRTTVFFGERFHWERDDVLGVVLTHRRFSLLGYGNSHAAAASMLVERTIELAKALVPRSGEELPSTDEGGRQLQEYLAHVLHTVESL